MRRGATGELSVAGVAFRYLRLADVSDGLGGLPFAIKVLLENALAQAAAGVQNDEVVARLAEWRPDRTDAQEMAFAPGRVLLQDFTGVPAIADLAAMRDALAELGGDPARVNPACPAELVIDHSVIAEVAGRPDAFERNAQLEFDRNRERYAFLRWGQQAFASLGVVPPDTGIVHQVNLEHLARVVAVDQGGVAHPDTLVGTDSHTTMVNGLGVLGWGVGGIEAEAALLGQPLSMLVPKVVGVRLTRRLPAGSTATDLVLTVTQVLRAKGVVGEFVEFFGPGLASLSVADRATVGNMSPEYGSTCAIFPIDDETLRYLRLTGRSADQVALVEAYAKEQGLFYDAGAACAYSDVVDLDLGAVEPSIAGPARPQDRAKLSDARRAFRAALSAYRASKPPAGAELPLAVGEATPEGASANSFPASDPPAAMAGVTGTGRPDTGACPCGAPGDHSHPPSQPRDAVPVRLPDDTTFALTDGAVVIAAITSCTNTSNPVLMLTAGLVARNAARRGLRPKPWVKTSLAPGSRVVMDYYRRAGLLPDLEALGFHLVGFGCTTCIGNSGPLAPEVSAAIREGQLAACAVLSGNRNFEGRIHPDCRMNFLASPPLVIAYALAGTVDIDLTSDPLGTDAAGRPVSLAELWPDAGEVQRFVEHFVRPDMFTAGYSGLFGGDERWRSLPTPTGARFAWDPASTYIRQPPFLVGLTAEPSPPPAVSGARVLALLGDSVTTDHISPAGPIATDSPAGRYLTEAGVAPSEFNSYGSRRGNHHVMVRGTFANIRLRNQLAPGTEGGITRHLPDGEEMPIYDAAMRYGSDGVPLLVIAGTDYGAGSSRDWAAKGTALLGVRAVLARSFERIHRSNLIGMGVLPLQFAPGQSAASLGITGTEAFDIEGLGSADAPLKDVGVRANNRTFTVTVRLDTPEEVAYWQHGGILPYVARRLHRRTI